MARTYENFDVELVAAGSTYEARFHSIAGEPTATIPFPLEDHELKAFLDLFGTPQKRSLETPEFARVRAVGQRLFDTLFTAENRKALTEATRAAMNEGRGLRLRIDVSEAKDLGTVPWEYLYFQEADNFVSLSNWTPVVRHLNVAEPLPAIRLEGPLRILVMISDPIERRGTLDVEREWLQLDQALAGPISRGEIELVRLPNGQLETLQVDLQNHNYHVFHFIGHGEYSESAQDGVLVLEDAHAREIHVAGKELGTYLKDSLDTRLVVLNNCEGAAFKTDPFTGTAQSLVRRGIPAVVAMQFEITDKAAIDFARGFYTSLGNGFPVDAALAEARKVISGGPTKVEFGSPVLYMSADDGILFFRDETPAIPDEKPKVPPPPDDDQPKKPTEEEVKPDRRRALVFGGVGLLGILLIVLLFNVFNDNDTPPGSTTAGSTQPGSTAGTNPNSTVPIEINPFVPWARVEDQPDLGGEGDQAMHNIVEVEDGWVAVGSETTAAGKGAAVWTSFDGTQWSQASPDGFPKDGAEMRGLVRFGDGLVAAGVGGGDAIVWTSADGAEVERVTSASLGGEGDQAIRGLTVWDDTLVAVGWDHSGADPKGAVWTSTNGVDWVRARDPQNALGGDGSQRIHDVVAGGPGLIAVGDTNLAGEGWNAEIWVSTDGDVWDRLEEPGAGLSGAGDQLLNVVEAGPDDLVAAGFDSAGDMGRDAAVWTSSDGLTWTQVGDRGVLGGPNDQEIHGLARVGTGWVAGGWTHPEPGDKDAAIWASEDGVTWVPREDAGAGLGGPGAQQVETVAASGSVVIAIGAESGLDAGTDGMVWIGRPE